VGCKNGIAHSVSRENGTAHSESGQWHRASVAVASAALKSCLPLSKVQSAVPRSYAIIQLAVMVKVTASGDSDRISRSKGNNQPGI